MESSKKRADKNEQGIEKSPRSLEIATKGVHTGADFAGLMSALMSDLIEGRIDSNVGNAVCNAGGKLLKVVEMQHRYGSKANGTARVLELAPPAESPA